MALVVNDRVKESTAVVGTGTATLLGAATRFQAFSVIGNGNTTYYCIADQGGANWEVGIGTYTLSGTTLARTTVLSSSNSNALVSFTAGTKDVFCTYPASKSVNLDASGNATALGTPVSGVVTNLTGTASININGTVGATTATTGRFTTLEYTSTFTGGTGVINIGSGQLYKDASGNVGIGTSSPAGKLHVTGGRSVFAASSEPFAVGARYSAAGGQVYFGATDATATPGVQISAATGAALLNITTSGNVGIGTSSPAQKLSVAGTIESTTGGVKFPDGTTQTSAGMSTGKALALSFTFNI
jgi:hypothetical protein